MERGFFNCCRLTAYKQEASPLDLSRLCFSKGLTLGGRHKRFFSIGANVLAGPTAA